MLHVLSLEATDWIHKEVISMLTVKSFAVYTSPHVDLISFHCLHQRFNGRQKESGYGYAL